VTDLKTLISLIDTLPSEDLDQLYKYIERRRSTATKPGDAKRQAKEAERIRAEVNSEIDQALEAARQYHLGSH